MLEGNEGFGVSEILTFTGERVGRDRERWLQRAISGTSERLAALRDRILDAASLERHALVLDLNAASGLLTWEAIRRASEGGVYALAGTAAEANALREMAARLPEPERPVILQGWPVELPELLAARGEDGAAGRLRFDAIVGRNALMAGARSAKSGEGERLRIVADVLAGLLGSGGRIILAEIVPRHAQRLYALADLSGLSASLAERVRAAEEAIYHDAPDDPLVNWDEEQLRVTFEAAGFRDVNVSGEEGTGEIQVTPALLARWFAEAPAEGRPSYGQRLLALLAPDEVTQVRAVYGRQLVGRAMPWRSVTAHLSARAGG